MGQNDAGASEKTLLDEVGRLPQPVAAAQIASWKRELNWNRQLNATPPPARRAAWLHLWLGEWELASNQQPRQADWHFRQARRLLPYADRLYGLASYDQAVTLFYEGAYAEAADAFAALLRPKQGGGGYGRICYDGRSCALWLRHAQACAGYHAEHARLGIPEPPRLDPFCGVASLAACLRALALPCDRAGLLRACRVTGEGSSLEDVLNGGRNFGLNARAVTADDQGVRALPKPLVAYVERDHFVALVRADGAGVSYLCSDCGPWPGGRVDLTWAQWHALEPGIYVAATRPGSRADRLLREALAPGKAAAPGQALSRPATRVTYAGPLSAFRLGLHLPSVGLSALRGHVRDYRAFDKPVTCGGKPEALHCPGHIHCPTASPVPASCHAPGMGDPVNLATGEEEYAPEPDLVVYNPIGPSVSWARIYNSLRAPVVYPEQYPVSYGVGWSYSYNVRIYAPNGITSGSTAYVIFANGSSVPLGITSQTTQLGPFLVSPGVPFKAELNSSGIVLTMKDRTRWVFGVGRGYSNLAKITDRNGHSINFQYYNGTSLTAITDDNGKALLTVTGNQSVSDCYGRTVWYQVGTFGTYSYQELTNVSQVVPTSASPPANLPSRYAYNYANVPNGDGAEVVPFLHTIMVPSPTGTGTGTSTATLWYLNQQSDGVKTNPNYSTAANSGPFVSAVVDSNGNTTTMSPLSGINQSKVQVTNAAGTVLRTSLYGFDSQMRLTSLTDYNQKLTQTRVYNDPNDPYEPSSVIDGNNYGWSLTWDQYGHLTSEAPSQSGSRQTATTTYSYDTTYFPMGELVSIQASGKKATTITYDHIKGFRQYNGGPVLLSGYPLRVQSPQPGQHGVNATTVTTSFVFDSWGNLTSLTAPGNNATYATPGNPATDQGITTAFNYTADGGSYTQAEAIGQPLTVTDNLGHVTHLRYDSFGRRSSVTDALGYATTYAYNLADQPVQITRPATQQTGNGQSYTLYTYQYVGGPLAALAAYDENNALVRQVSYQYGTEGETLAVGGSTEPAQYAYDGLYRVTALADGNGQATHYYFNPNGYLDTVTYPGYTGAAYPSVSGPDSVRYPAYDGDGNPTKRLDGNGVETDYTYNDPESLLTSVHYPGGQLTDVSFTYDLYGRVSAMTDGTGVTSYEGGTLPGYDDLDNPLAVQTAYANVPAQTVGYGYFNNGSRSALTVPGRAYTYSYDKAGRFTGLANNVGESAAWTYQDNDWPLLQTDSNGLKAYSVYNALGQLTDLQNTSAGSLISEFGDPTHGRPISHDGVGNALSVTSYLPAEGYATASYAYDTRDQLTQETSARGGGFANAFGYDPAGNPISLRGSTPPYNINNQAIAPTANNPAFASDGNGNPGAARGRSLAFDPENRLTGAADQASGVPTAVGIGPDNVLRQLNTNSDGSISIYNVRLSDGSTTQAYYHAPVPDWTCTALAVGPDNLTRVLWNHADGQMSVWTIQTNGSIISTPGYGPIVGWACRGLAVGPDSLIRVLWTRTSDGQMSVWTIKADNASYTSTPGYGPIPGWACRGLAVGPDNLTRVMWTRTSDGQMSAWTIKADNTYTSTPGYGPIPGWTCTGLAVGADNLKRVLWVRTSDKLLSLWRINSDATVDITSTAGYAPPQAGYVPVNIVMDSGETGHLLYGDSHGNSIILNILPDNVSTSILASQAASHVAGTGASSAYRGDGLRAWKQNDSGARTYYLYDGTLPVCELSSTGSPVAQTMFGAEGLVSRNTSSGTAWYAFDERGNVAQRVNASGAVTATDLYDAFGQRRAGGEAGDPFGFGGQAGYYTDGETGLVLCTHRYYDPAQGRFLTRDPVGYGGGINLYSYTQNNPINEMDPDGLLGRPVKPGVPGGAMTPGGPYYYGVPSHPAGVNIFTNIGNAYDHRNWPTPLKNLWFAGLVGPYMEWDYKQDGRDLPYVYRHYSDMTVHENTYDAFGNFNFGAAAAAAGINEQYAIEQADRNHDFMHGSKAKPWDHGDWWVRAGYDWYNQQKKAGHCK